MADSATVVAPIALFQKYENEIRELVKSIQEKTPDTISLVVAKIVTETLPNLMTDAGMLTSLSGAEKKQLVMATVEYIIGFIFDRLNENTDLQNSTWDEVLEQLILKTSDKLIDAFIEVEDGSIKFNNKAKLWGKIKNFFCCGSGQT